MHASQNSRFITHFSLLFLVVNFLINLPSESVAATRTLTAVMSPPAGGSIVGAGTYTFTSFELPYVPISITANEGWYLKNVIFTGGASPGHNPGSYFREVTLNQPNGFDFTTITNFVFDAVDIGGNPTVEAVFASLSPSFTSAPASRTALSGTSLTLSGTAVGRQPMSYVWQRNDVEISGEAASTLVLNPATMGLSGEYTLIAMNAYGTNAVAASVVIRDVLAYIGGVPVTEPFENLGPVNIVLDSTNGTGQIFYTLDGSEPTFASQYYGGPITITESSVLRAKAYTPDFSSFVTMEPLSISVIPTYTILKWPSRGGGTATIEPNLDRYPRNSMVTLRAIPDSGWTFMGWEGDLSGRPAETTITVTHNLFVQAIFGTPFQVASSGNGTVAVHPNVPLHPFGTPVLLSATPDQGYYLKRWAGISADGNYWTVSEPNKTALAQFAELPPGTVGLTIINDGNGVVTSSKGFTPLIGETTTITATPRPYQTFIGWGGDISGTENPRQVIMNGNMVVRAHFSRTPFVGFQQEGATGYLRVYSPLGDVCEVQSSNGLLTWTSGTIITNYYGEAFLPVQLDGSSAFFRVRNLSIP